MADLHILLLAGDGGRLHKRAAGFEFTNIDPWFLSRQFRGLHQVEECAASPAS